MGLNVRSHYDQKNALYGIPASTGRPRTTTVEASWTTNSSSVSAAFTLIGRRRMQYPEHIYRSGSTKPAVKVALYAIQFDCM